MSVAAVVLAGGTSARFGSDKLAIDWSGRSLLDHVVCSLPEAAVIVVGPPRALSRPVRFVREDPPGSGPAAALVAGIAQTCADVVVTLPGDAPYAAAVAASLIGALGDHDAVAAMTDRVNPLQLALCGAALQRARALDPSQWVGASARRLAELLGAHPVPVDAALAADIDTPQDLSRWQRAPDNAEG